MTSRRRLRPSSERSQALVEFAFVGIIFFLLIFGFVDVGRAVWNYNTLAQATREGTRYAIVHGANAPTPVGPGTGSYTAPSTDTNVTQQVEQYAAGLNPSRVTVESQWLDGNNSFGSRVKVTTNYTYEPLFNFFGIVSFAMHSSSTMTITN